MLQDGNDHPAEIHISTDQDSLTINVQPSNEPDSDGGDFELRLSRKAATMLYRGIKSALEGR